jgi:predicted ferric reductase
MLTITAIRPETPSVASIVMEGAEVASFAKRRAGQFALLKVERDGVWSEPHPFTLTCSPEDPFLQMTFKMQGAFTTALRAMPVGTRVTLQGPLGSFCKGVDEKAAVVLIAGGIGITPFLSLLRHWRNTKAANRATLVWANNEPADIFAQNELTKMASVVDLKVVHVVWKPGETPLPAGSERMVYESGTLTSDICRRRVDFAGAAIYLCGSPNMQGFVFPQLEACGVDTKAVQVEKFAWPPPRKP